MDGWHRAARATGMTILALVVGGSGALAQGTAEDAERAFEEVYAAFSAAYQAGDPAAVAALYGEDAFYLAPGGEIERGEVARHFEFLSSFEPGTGPVIEFEIMDRTISGDLAYDIGYYTLRRAGADTSQGRGKFIVIWKRGADGVWRIHADGYSGVDDDKGASHQEEE